MLLTKINDISPYFKKKENKWIFTGKKLEVWIPKFYQDKGLLVIGDIANCLGIVQLRINDSLYANTMVLARLSITFVSNRIETEGDDKYVVLSLETGSVFIANSAIVKDSNIIYEIFVAFLAYGNMPKFIDYNASQMLFDRDSDDCGVSLKVNHSIFEMISAHMFRDSKDPYMFYRYTMMDKQPQIVAMHQISHGPSSSTARIIGSYLSEGMTSALVDDNVRAPSLIENLLRS